ncbi:hypothetical protein GCM10011519_27080 [Marmoricola endophyticus]|uniref:Glycosyltransferase n=1 Tax=Marmoricola endophyticus TaxID=2040280 RepID=A0A917BP67_9ACTN|nr:glycosyltransferase [Marmoricola endophyticus]GGF51652.1 hypothetical protein GCM10011519_27080 [Marmoricola endophyticus]
MPATSIVVPSRGGAERLDTLLDSVAAQTDDDLEVVVVLDGDVDGSEAVVARRTDVPVRSIVFPENRGRSAALNAGFADARGEILVRCDDDLELEPDFVARHRALHADREVGIVTMCLEAYARPTAYSRAYGVPADARIRRTALATTPDQTWRWWCGCVSARRETYDRVGGYDERYRGYGMEDVDWGYRLHALGVPILVPDGFTTLHHGPVTSVEERARRALHSGAARLTFEAIHGEGVLDAPLTAEAARQRQGRTAWSRLVDLVAGGVTERSVSRVGSVLDRRTQHLPPWVAQKLVALLVESAGVAGRRHPERIGGAF